MFAVIWLSSIILGIISFLLVKQWIYVMELPPGPLPIPILGNLLMFSGKKIIREIMMEIKKKYGGIYTLWMANNPFVIVADWEVAREALVLKRDDFASRPDLPSVKCLKEHLAAIAFSESGPELDVTRKVGFGAVRKLLIGEELSAIVHRGTNEFIESMLQPKDAFDPFRLIQRLVLKIVSDVAFGQDNVTENEYQKFQKFTDKLETLVGNTPGDLSPLLRPLFYQRELELKNVTIGFGQLISEKFAINQKRFERGEIRSFSDAVITSALEANEEDSQGKNYLSDKCLSKLIGILFLGDRMPLQSDKASCPYTLAFISEMLRLCNVLPIGFVHTAAVDSELGGYKIRKGTTVVFHAEAMHMNPELWVEPDSFNPGRFLNEDGSYNQEKTKGFLAFGQGKRMCIGEKLARNELFLVIANLVQRVEIKLDVPSGTSKLEAENNALLNVPKKYNISVSIRK